MTTFVHIIVVSRRRFWPGPLRPNRYKRPVACLSQLSTVVNGDFVANVHEISDEVISRILQVNYKFISPNAAMSNIKSIANKLLN